VSVLTATKSHTYGKYNVEGIDMGDNFDNSTARRIIDMVNDGQVSAYEVMLVLLNHMSEEQVRDTAKKSLLFNEDYVAIQKEMGYE